MPYNFQSGAFGANRTNTETERFMRKFLTIAALSIVVGSLAGVIAQPLAGQ